MRASAIITAAGSGQRLGRGAPKAFVKLGGRTMLSYSLASVASVPGIEEVIITVPAGMETVARSETSQIKLPVKIVAGGAERQDSIRIALSFSSAESELIVIHDAARPFADARLFDRCLEAAKRSGGAIAAVPVSDTLKRGENGAIIATVPRAGLWQAQTPQAFLRSLIIAAHERATREKIIATDDADLVEQIGARVELIESSTRNIKITTPSDLEIAEAILTSLRS
ncbi:MAG TPA: 2-C-methyl-D-erythritol 4-phosphate cytidylyltransferase [Candidatus Binataceae bacterium]|nr:2-C-methyl-D-erythritol 4-phosphate cytidylyltransferase [Candidatus Binataceae bacterium]